MSDKVITNEPQIAPETYLRLALLQSSTNALFPSLKRLKIIDANLSLSQLFLFLTPSLTALEIASLPNMHQDTVASFLDALPKQAQLTDIRLGSGSLNLDYVHMFLNFEHLRHLEIMDIIGAFDYHLLERIGSLERLEVLRLDAKMATYSCLVGPLSVTDISGDRPREASVLENDNAFPRLRKLILAGSIDLIGDILHSISSNKVEDVSLKLVASQSLPREPWWAVVRLEQPQDNMASSPAEASVFPPPTSCGSMSIKSDLAGTTKKKKKSSSQSLLATSTTDSQKRRISLILEQLIELGCASLKSLILDTDISSLSLCTSTFQRLIARPSLEHLEVIGWSFAFDAAPLSNVSMGTPCSLGTLIVPISDLDLGIPLPALRIVAESCPNLKHLQCQIKSPATLHDLVGELSKFTPISHKLETLSVGNISSFSSQQLLVARYLYALFPNLKTIETHIGRNAEQWTYVHELIKMCQSARVADLSR